MVLNEKRFNRIKEFRYQFVIGTKDNLYYLSRGKQIHNTYINFLAFDERTGRIEAVRYEDVTFIIKDGVKQMYDNKQFLYRFRRAMLMFFA